MYDVCTAKGQSIFRDTGRCNSCLGLPLPASHRQRCGGHLLSATRPHLTTSLLELWCWQFQHMSADNLPPHPDPDSGAKLSNDRLRKLDVDLQHLRRGWRSTTKTTSYIFALNTMPARSSIDAASARPRSAKMMSTSRQT